ncbi:MAG: prepilin-type N-terminal cleavage/methylation domain-containing protein [Mariprofundaceae bacterium]|nr:prepilin-type N-terminal cleavage/methylation domain-containing protein [Mariprofundaceae bacterium]
MHQQEQGFTLLELLFVALIIGILASIALVSYHGIEQSSLNNSVEQDLHNTALTCQNYYGEKQAYVGFGPFTSSKGSSLFYIAPSYSIKLSPGVTMKGIVLPDQSLNLIATHAGSSQAIKIIRHLTR